MSWSYAGLGLLQGGSELIEVYGLERQLAGLDPAVHLLRRASPNDRTAQAGPAQCPGDRDRRDRNPMSCGDRPKGFAKRQVATEQGLIEFGVATTPIIGVHPINPLAADGGGEEPGFHRTVVDHSGAMRGAPGNDVPARLSVDHRER